MLQRIFFVTWVMMGWLVFAYQSAAQTPEALSPDCVQVQAYMDSDVSPDRLIQGGGQVDPEVAVSAAITDTDAGDRWVFGGQAATDVQIVLESEIPLRVRLYLGMEELLDVATVAGSRTLTAELPSSGLYTLVVSRQNLLERSLTGSYRVTVSGAAAIVEPNKLVTIPDSSVSRFIFYNRLRPGQTRADIHLNLNRLSPEQVSVFVGEGELPLTSEGNIVQATLSTSDYHVIEVRNGTGGSFTLNAPSVNSSRIATLETLRPPRWDSYPNAPELSLQNGIIEFTMEDNTRIRTFADTFSSVSPIPLFFFADRQSGFRFGRNSADSISLLDGSLSIARKDNTGFIYVESFDWQGQFVDDSNFQNFRLISGEDVRVDWNETENLWILPNCIGIELTQGRRIVAEAKEILARQTQEPGFTLEAIHPAENLTYDVNVDWQGLAQVIFSNGVVRLLFEENREFQTDQLELTVRRALTEDTGQILQTILSNGEDFVSTDWDNISSISILGTNTRIEVQDEREVIERNNRVVRTLETAEEAIRIRWEDGSESLLLPATEDFIQIETPAEPTSYDPFVLPGSAGFLPAGFNNTGLECYPINTTFDFNCAENGLVNPANGNLVYSISDLYLPAYANDFTLTRTYNSRSAALDGPFGYGWSTDYVLDFSGKYDPNDKARLIDETTPYKMMLDLTQAPRGQVIFTTPSGSRHLFRAEAPGEALVSDTLPGWEIPARADDLGADWRVYRSDGLVYLFDRAGRLTAIDYPQSGGLVVTRLSAFPEATYRLQNPLLGQSLILEFDDFQHITRSALYDSDDTLLDEVRYDYDRFGRLIHVRYLDGTEASYRYDESNRLIFHSDPRAPIASELYYLYDSQNRVTQISLSENSTTTPVDGTAPIYRRYSYLEGEATFTTTVFNEWGAAESWQFEITRDPRTAYRLVARSRNDEEIDQYEYELSNFLITRIVHPGYNQEMFYEANGALNLIQNKNGLIGFQATYADLSINGHTVSALSSYRNDTSDGPVQMQIVYDPETGQVRRWEDVNGLVTEITERDPVFGLPTVLVVSDGDTQSEIRFVYDERGYPISRTDSRGTYQFVWDRLGRLAEYVDPLSRRYTITYDGLCRVVTDPIQVTTTSCYDERKRLVESEIRSSTLLRKTTYTYDAFDRLIQVQQFLEDSSAEDAILTTRYEYLAGATSGHWILRTTDPYQRVQEVEYDAFNRVVRTVDALNQETTYEYQSGNNSETTTAIRRDATGLETRLSYNLANQLCSFRYMDTEVLAYEVFYGENTTCNEPQRNISLLTIPNMTLRFENYDAAGRPEQISFFVDAPYDENPASLNGSQTRFSLEYRYDAYGRLTAYSRREGTNLLEAVSFIYVDGGREVQVTRENGTLTYTYDALDRLVGVNSNDSAVTYTYRDLPEQRLLEVQAEFSSINSSERQRWTLYYDGVGNLREWVDHNNIRTVYTYDALSRLLEVTANGSLVASYTYNKLNQVLLIRNQYQQEYHYVYNAFGLLTTARDFDDVVTVYTYDQFGNVSSVTDALGYRISYLYDNHNRLTTIIDAAGREQEFDWTDARKGHLRYTSGQRSLDYYFDLMGRLWQIRDEENNPHFLRYDLSGRLIGFWPYASRNVYNDQLGWLLAYEANDTLAAIDSPVNDVRQVNRLEEWGWRFTSDAFSRLVGRRDPNGHLLTFAYDGLGRLLEVAAPDSFRRTYTYAPQTITLVTDSKTTQISHDEFYRLTSRVESDEKVSLTTRYLYTDSRNFSVTDPFGAQTQYIYPQETDVDQPYYLIVQDVGREYRYTVNARGELIGIQREEIFENERYRTEEQVSYDPSGRPIRYVDAQNNPFTIAYDTEGNLITFQTPDGTSSFYEYDARNNLIKITNPGNQVIQVNYNKQGLVETIRLNDTLLESYAYHPDGTLRRREFDENVIEYSYDGAGNIIGWRTLDSDSAVTLTRTADAFARIRSADGSRFLYDAQGNVVSADNDVVGYDFDIDPIGRLLGVVEDDTRVWEYQYGENGRSYTLVIGDDPDHRLEVVIDSSQRLQSLASHSSSIVIAYQVRANENFIQAELTWGDGFQTQVRFNRLGQVVRVVHSRNDINFETLTFNYELNYLGLPQSIDEPEHDIFVGYDAAYRPAITRWLYTGPEDPNRLQDSIQYAFTITYDRLGNRRTELVQELDGSQHLYIYESTGRQLQSRSQQQNLTASGVLLLGLGGILFWKRRRPQLLLIGVLALALVSVSPQMAQVDALRYVYEYDPNGHLARITEFTAGVQTDERVFSYDAFGRLIEINSEAGSSQFAYDAFGRLVTWEKDRIFNYRYDGNRLVEVTSNQPHMVATLPDMPLLLMDNGTPQWALYDGLGGLRQSFAENNYADVSISSSQNIFGVPIADLQNSDFPLPFFQGMLYDPTHRIYIRLDGIAYDPDTGRYLQRDVLGPDANGDLYAYREQRFSLPVLRRESYPFLEGVNALAEAQIQILDSSSILQGYLPDFSLAWQDTGLAALHNFNQDSMSQQTRYADLPHWLGYTYNPPGVVVGDNGNFQFLESGISGQPTANRLFPQHTPTIGTAFEPFSLLQADPAIPTWTQPDGWRAVEFWPTEVPQPYTGQRIPALVDAFVQYPLMNLGHYPALTAALENLPVENADKWLEQIDAATLPTAPDVLPTRLSEWLAQWFTSDTFPVWGQLREIYDLPEPPGPELPSLGLTQLGGKRFQERD